MNDSYQTNFSTKTKKRKFTTTWFGTTAIDIKNLHMNCTNTANYERLDGQEKSDINE